MTVKSTSRVRVAIVGGGIAGLACALEFARRGALTTVFEAGQAGRGALWASGGMLAGMFESAESRACPALADLARRGLELWKDWSSRLGPDAIGYRAAGSLSPASGAAGRDWLDQLVESAAAQGFRVERMPPPAPVLAEDSVFFPADGELDNRLLGPRLVDTLRAMGVGILENQTVASVRPWEGGGLEVISAPLSELFHAVVVATGNQRVLEAVDPSISALVPVKGEMMALEGDGLNLPVCVRGQAVYLSQKADRRIVIGATSEAGRTDLAVDAGHVAALRRSAEALVPALEGATEIERWAGVRPGTPDARPIIGESRTPGVFLALGLYRNGVLFSPAVAEMLADAVLAGRALPAAFSPRRFDER